MKKLLLWAICFIFSMNAWSQIKNNNIALRPFAVNNTGLGMGLQFEHYIDSEQYFSLVAPLDFLIVANNNDDAYYSSAEKNSFGLSTQPAIRFYFKKPSTTNWYLSVGLQGSMVGSTFDTIIWNNNNVKSINSYSFGTITNIGFKSTINHKITLGAEFGLGLGLINRTSYSYFTGNDYKTANKINALSNFNVQIGYVF